MYRVVKSFFDLQDSAHFYAVGDTYPRDSIKVRASRIEELLSPFNAQGTPLIEEVEEKKEEPKKAEPKKEEPKEEKKVTRKKK